jgi:hypothetical protein
LIVGRDTISYLETKTAATAHRQQDDIISPKKLKGEDIQMGIYADMKVISRVCF